jgi:branched-chain amino acid transport system permease protein
LTTLQATTATVTNARPLPYKWIALGLIVALLAAVAPALNPYYVRVLTIGLLYAYLASSWNVIGGYAGQMSLGHAMFFGLGSYSVAMLSKSQLPLLLGLPISLVLAGIVAWCVALICFRYALKGIYFAVGTLLLAEIARMTVMNSETLGRSQGIQIPPADSILNFGFSSDLPFFYIFLAMTVGIAVGVWFMSRSRFGYALVALREQEDAARALAIDVTQVKRRAFVVSAMLTTVAGVVYAGMIRFVEPGYDFSISMVLMMVMGAVLGGRGTVLGPIVGGFVVVLIQESLTTIGSLIGTTSISALAQMIYGLFFVVVLLAFPRGIVGEIIARRADRLASLKANVKRASK